jgi:hypothetical protein
MRGYSITLEHDKGKIKIHTVAKDKAAALKIIMESENCPSSAIKTIIPIKDGYLLSNFILN